MNGAALVMKQPLGGALAVRVRATVVPLSSLPVANYATNYA
jgi:hypothetical protein